MPATLTRYFTAAAATLALFIALCVTTAPVTAQTAPDVTVQSPDMPAAPAAEPETSPQSGAISAPPDTTAAAPASATITSNAPATTDAVTRSARFLRDGGPAIWAIAALSVITVALILWKIWRFALAGVWSRRASFGAVSRWESGDHDGALAALAPRRGLRSRLTRAAMQARLDLPDAAAREETARVAKRLLSDQSTGLRALELIATIAPLLGLLGTVLGMIAAFQALQAAGSQADPALLAGGIWEALLTTAAGMAVAIPASAALSWCESVLDSLRHDMEDIAARVFVAALPIDGRAAPDIKTAKSTLAAK